MLTVTDVTAFVEEVVQRMESDPSFVHKEDWENLVRSQGESTHLDNPTVSFRLPGDQRSSTSLPRTKKSRQVQVWQPSRGLSSLNCWPLLKQGMISLLPLFFNQKITLLPVCTISLRALCEKPKPQHLQSGGDKTSDGLYQAILSAGSLNTDYSYGVWVP